MKYKILFVLVLFSMFVFFISGCAVQGANQGDENLNVKTPEISKSKISAFNILKIVKADSNLSWAAAAKIAIVSHYYRYDHSIVDSVWQGDISSVLYNGNRNAIGYTYQDMNYDMERAVNRWGISETTKKTGVASINDIYLDIIEGHPVLITRTLKNNHYVSWAVVIYAINTDNNQISVWDPEHGWDYTCDYSGFANDSRYDQLSLVFHKS